MLFRSKYVVDRLDHKNLNDREFVEDGLNPPTAERIVGWIVSELSLHFGQNLRRVRLYETDNSYAEWNRSS